MSFSRKKKKIYRYWADTIGSFNLAAGLGVGTLLIENRTEC